jgi:hypothetical protein
MGPRFASQEDRLKKICENRNASIGRHVRSHGSMLYAAWRIKFNDPINVSNLSKKSKHFMALSPKNRKLAQDRAAIQLI